VFDTSLLPAQRRQIDRIWHHCAWPTSRMAVGDLAYLKAVNSVGAAIRTSKTRVNNSVAGTLAR
jgi:hypothetical protein